MRHWVLVPVVVLVQAVTIAQIAGLEFDVASIRRTLGDVRSAGDVRAAETGRIVLRSTTARGLVLRAYPTESTPPELIGLPGWADTERYDVEVKTTPSRTPNELQQMWRTLLADRMKLLAHYEVRDIQSYDLVMARADQRLGPNLRPSRLDCSRPQAPPSPLSGVDIKQLSLSVCSRAFTDRDSTTYAGGIRIVDLVRAAGLMGTAGRPIVDRTGLDGYFEVTLRYWRGPELPGRAIDDVPSLFTALQEQLGLKLQAASTQTEVIVVDHIERPTAN